MSDVFLMHQNKKVAEMVVQDGHIATVKVVDPDLLPFALSGNGGWITPLIMESWERTRAVPSNRPNIDRLVREIGISLAEAKEKEMAVSLTDCYWHKEAGLNLSWEDVNFYQNAGSGDLSQIILSGRAGNVPVDLHSPDFTTGGYMEKTWIFTGGKPFLLKRGSLGEYAGGKNLQSANEVAAYHVSRLMGVCHVPYFRVQLADTGENLCACPSFIHSPDKDFISAGAIRSALLISGKSMYRELTRKDGIFHAGAEIQQMILFDHIIHNADRHEDNFGFIRDAEDFSKMDPAPLLLIGTALPASSNLRTCPNR